MEDPVLYKGFLVYRSGKVEVPVEGGENVVVEPREYTLNGKKVLNIRFKMKNEYKVGNGKGFTSLKSLVFEAYNGTCGNTKKVVQHIDKNYKNCSLNNLSLRTNIISETSKTDVCNEFVMYKGFMVYKNGMVKYMNVGEAVEVKAREMRNGEFKYLVIPQTIQGLYCFGKGYIKLKKLVFDAFNGDSGQRLLEHIDGNHANCKLENLRFKQIILAPPRRSQTTNIEPDAYVVHKGFLVFVSGKIEFLNADGTTSEVDQQEILYKGDPKMGFYMNRTQYFTRKLVYDAYHGEKRRRFIGHRDREFRNCALQNLYTKGCNDENEPDLDFELLEKMKVKYLNDTNYRCAPVPLSRYASHRDGYLVNMLTGNIINGSLNKSIDYFGHLLSSDSNETLFRYTHRFVYECFFPDFDKSLQVDHDDTNTHNNCIDNLVARTTKDHGYKTTMTNPDRGGKVGIALGKPIICKSRETGEIVHTFNGVGEAAKGLKIAGSNLRKILDSDDNISRCGTQLWFWKPDIIEGEKWYKITYDVTEEHAPEGIKGLVGLEVSDMCRIRSYSGKITIGSKYTEHAYRRFTYNGKYRTIHQVMCFLYHGVPQEKDMTVDHWDIDKTNNFGDNLRWATRQQQGENTTKSRKVIQTHITTGSIKVFDTISSASKVNGISYRSIIKLCITGSEYHGKTFTFCNDEKPKLYDYIVNPDPTICIEL